MLMQDKLTIVGDQLTGRGVTFDVSLLVPSKGKVDPGGMRDRLVEIGEALYLQGRSSILPMWDDRFDLSCAAEALRALAVVMGPTVGDRHRRAADALERLLHEVREV